MTLNELVLTSLENFESFAIQVKIEGGKYKDKILTEKLYEKLYEYEVEEYYLNINTQTNKPYIVVKLEDYQ